MGALNLLDQTGGGLVQAPKEAKAMNSSSSLAEEQSGTVSTDAYELGTLIM